MTIAQNQTANDTFDAFDAAMTVHKNEYIQFCEITIIDPWFCVLEQGVGKRKFNPDEDNISQRRTSIDIVCVPVRMNENGTTYDVRQSAIDTSKDWQKITLPSIRNLGLNLRSMIGAFVKLKKTKTGETYTNKTTGALVEKTAIEFLEVYPDRAACQAAADAHFAQFKKHENGNGSNGTTGVTQTAQEPAQAATDDAERTAALNALPVLWTASGKNVTAFHAMLKSAQNIYRHFNESSPEVLALTGNIPF